MREETAVIFRLLDRVYCTSSAMVLIGEDSHDETVQKILEEFDEDILNAGNRLRKRLREAE